jgi:hypothetical protein
LLFAAIRDLAKTTELEYDSVTIQDELKFSGLIACFEVLSNNVVSIHLTLFLHRTTAKTRKKQISLLKRCNYIVLD